MNCFRWAIAVVGVIGLALCVSLALAARSDFKRHPFPPERIRAICAPITDYLKQCKKKTGTYPQMLPGMYEGILAVLPFTASYDHGTYDNKGEVLLSVGEMGEWPSPLYSYYWVSKDDIWRFSGDYQLPDNEISALLTKRGYKLNEPFRELVPAVPRNVRKQKEIRKQKGQEHLSNNPGAK